MSPPIVHKTIENYNENHVDMTASSKNPFTIDESISATTQTAIVIATTTTSTNAASLSQQQQPQQQLDNGDVAHHTINENNCNEVL